MINLILAWDINRLIGSNQDLPWYYPEDLKYFKAITLNKTVLMGRKTLDSILKRNKKPLPSRKNVVLSHQENVHDDVETIHDLKEYLLTHTHEEIFVIGGKSIFEQSIQYADKLYITEILKSYQGDIYLKEIDLSTFTLVSKTCQDDLCFCIYERKTTR